MNLGGNCEFLSLISAELFPLEGEFRQILTIPSFPARCGATWLYFYVLVSVNTYTRHAVFRISWFPLQRQRVDFFFSVIEVKWNSQRVQEIFIHIVRIGKPLQIQERLKIVTIRTHSHWPRNAGQVVSCGHLDSRTIVPHELSLRGVWENVNGWTNEREISKERSRRRDVWRPTIEEERSWRKDVRKKEM